MKCITRPGIPLKMRQTYRNKVYTPERSYSYRYCDQICAVYFHIPDTDCRYSSVDNPLKGMATECFYSTMDNPLKA